MRILAIKPVNVVFSCWSSWFSLSCSLSCIPEGHHRRRVKRARIFFSTWCISVGITMDCIDNVISRIPQPSGFRSTSLLIGCVGLVWGAVVAYPMVEQLVEVAHARSRYFDRTSHFDEYDESYGYLPAHLPEVPVSVIVATVYVATFMILSALLLVSITLKRTNWIRVWFVAFVSWLIAFSIPVCFLLSIFNSAGFRNRQGSLIMIGSASLITFYVISIYWIAVVKGYYVEAKQKQRRGTHQNF